MQLRASRSEAAAEELREKVRKFAQAAEKIKQGSTRRLERRDAVIAGLEATVAARDAQIQSCASAREGLLATIRCLQRRLMGKRAQASAANAELVEGSTGVGVRPEGVQETPRCAQAGRSALKSPGSSRPRAHSCRLCFEEDEALVAVLPIKSYRDADLWVRKPGTWSSCEQCEQRAPTSQGFLLSDCQRSQFMQERFLCGACASRAGVVARAPVPGGAAAPGAEAPGGAAA